MNENPGDRLHFRRVLAASPERVYQLWTEPEYIKRWFGGEETEVPAVEVDLREGGTYEITIREEDGGTSKIHGEFIVVEAPHRLVYTWRMERGSDELPTTTVEVTFNELGDRTEVLLVHAAFAEPQVRELHAAGWEACFASLADLL